MLLVYNFRFSPENCLRFTHSSSLHLYNKNNIACPSPFILVSGGYFNQHRYKIRTRFLYLPTMSNPTTNGPGTELPTSAPTLSPPPPPNQDQLLQIFAIRAQNDYDAMTLYAAIIGSVIGMFIVFKVIDHLGRKASLRQYSAAVRSPFSLLVR